MRKRKQGRPRRSWEDDIRELMTNSVMQAGALSRDRDAYRRTVWAAHLHRWCKLLAEAVR